MLGYEIIDLIKSICFSSQKNLIELTNQNIINVLFEINTKFINENKIVNDIDLIVNEIKKLPGQGVHIEHILLEAIKNFNQNMKNNFDNNDIKIKILNDLIIINSYNINKIQIKKLVSNIDFINNFISLLNKTLKEKTFSQIIDKLFTVEIELIKKIIRQLSLNKDKESDKLNQDLCDILLLILFHPSIFSNNFLLACKTFLYYIQNDYLYSKFLSHKIDKNFIEKMLEQKENYSADLQIIKVVNKIISYLALKNSDFAKYIVENGGFINIIEDLKTLVYLNDINNRILKYNSLIMIDSLLIDDNNMKIFSNSKGYDLINNILKNDATLITNKDDEITHQYKCFSCINCNDIFKDKNNKIKNDVTPNDIFIDEGYLKNTSKISNLKLNQENEENSRKMKKI